MKRLLTVLVATALLSLPAAAATRFTAVLDGATAGSPSAATGTAVLILNDDQTEVDYTIHYSTLAGNEIAAHFHNAAPGSDGPIMEPLPPGEPKVGVWSISPAQVVELMEGRVYINIHSDLYVLGEIRGNVTFDTVPSEASSFGALKSDYR